MIAIGGLLFVAGTFVLATALLGPWGFIAVACIWGGLILLGGQ